MKRSSTISDKDKWAKIPSDEVLEKTVHSLGENGMDAIVVENSEEAKNKVLEILPKGAEVMTMTSRTLETIGVLPEINESGNYDSVRNKLNSMKRDTQGREMQRLGAAPEWVMGSVHAVTQDGKVLIASNTGSQLPAYVYGSDHVIWVVGAQKIVKDLDEAWKRLYEHVLPLESERLKKVYGVPSNVSKVLIVQKEIKPGRITLIFVREAIGF
ncbi:MAG TPA: LUD domain-containing protein [Patescibacteria group bacterium]|nr:LUD domain-containing protein [Patescibacteria group bacterium]